MRVKFKKQRNKETNKQRFYYHAQIGGSNRGWADIQGKAL